MHNINITNVVFDIPLLPLEAVLFKKAISSAIHDLREKGETDGITIELFYNRDEETGNSEKRYPLIQFKSVKGKAAITAINEGTRALEGLLKLLKKNSNSPFNIKYLYNKQNQIDLSRYKLSRYQHTLSLKKAKQFYLVCDWLPLDTVRYKVWAASGELKMLAEIMDEALPRQISKMLTGVGLTHAFPFVAHTVAIVATKEKQQVYKEKKIPFDCVFTSNLDLPIDIGIGQVTGIGYGRILPWESKTFF